MTDTVPTRRLTHRGALKMLNAAVAKATEMGKAMTIVIVGAGGVPILSLRMDGAAVFTVEIATKKAKTAADMGIPSGMVPADYEIGIALATSSFTNFGGGFPIIVEGEVIGAIAASAGSAEEDALVAKAGLATLVP